MTVPEAAADKLVQKNRSMANLINAEVSYIPQDGTIKFNNNNLSKIQITVSTYPTDAMREDVALSTLNPYR
jgi:type II secretory ATPase GspE/PulE/Tfp pilus assembly ATPase PilB-like protein